ncbi:hypothetical protein QJQ45_023899 [Haematococcus lacustris]|nr:hypothetical protein QJQ45_023899 [Haematococcus lacustris]
MRQGALDIGGRHSIHRPGLVGLRAATPGEPIGRVSCVIGSLARRKSRLHRSQYRVEAVSSPTKGSPASVDPASPGPKPSHAITADAPASSSSAAEASSTAASDEEAGRMAAKITAVTGKINAARELARRLSEEKLAAQTLRSPETLRSMEEASAAAAAQAARADSLARALRKAESTRDQMQRLKAENEALRKLLLDLAADKEAAYTKLAEVTEATATGLAPPSSSSSSPPGSPSMLASLAPSPLAPPAPAAPRLAPAGGNTLPPLLAPTPAPPTPAPTTAPATATTTSSTASVDLGSYSGKDLGMVSMGMGAMGPATVAVPGLVPDTPPALPPAALDEGPDALQLDHIPEPPMFGDSPGASAAQAAPAVPQNTAPSAPAAPAPPAPAAAPVAPPPPAAPPAAAPAPAPAQLEPPPPVVPPPSAPPAIPSKPARAPNVLDRIKATPPQLQQLVRMAQQGGQQLFTLPSQPVPINGPVRLFYNRARGPLPEHSELVLKGGFNRWEVLKDWDLKRVDMIQRSHDQDWWEVTLDLPDDIFCFDYVLFDKRSGQYDNNNAKDFRLDLTGCPSEQQVLERRLEAYQEFESQRLRFLEAENARLWRQVELAALEAASGVRLEFRRKREVQLRAMAQQMVAERRRPELQALTTRAYIPGVLKWVTPPTAGKKALLAYNMGRGPLSGCNSVRLHLGYDGWWNQVKAEYDLAPMSNDDMNRHGLRQGVDGNHHWFACLVDVPHSGAVLDYVFSDRDQRNWDNNEYQDYHTTVEGAHTGAQLAELMYTALKRENEAADQVAEDVAAKRACRKVQSRGEALKRRRSSMNQFLYTVPYLPVAGQKVGAGFSLPVVAVWQRLLSDSVQCSVPMMEVFYNPEHTPLRGRPDIYLRTGWNRWSLNRHQPVPSYRMEPVLPGNIGFYRAEVLVPSEAWSADMVFIDTADVSVTPHLQGVTRTGRVVNVDARLECAVDASSTMIMCFGPMLGLPQQATGFFDNNGGLDYHIPVRAPNASGSAANNLGALTAMPLVHTPLKAAPASDARSHHRQTPLPPPLPPLLPSPAIPQVIHVAVEMAPIAKVGGMGDVVTALGRAVQEEGHSVECIIPKYDSINYSQVEQLRQEGGFAFGGTNVRVWKGIVDGLPTTFLEPENGHFWRGCIYGRNDDSVRFGFFCGAALQYLKTYNVQPSIIHCHDWPSAPVAWGDRMGAKCIFTIHNLSYGADLVARAMAACDVATTVSPTYAQELYGIRNGIDTDVWDPSSDPHLPVAYSPDAALEGKDAARRALRSKLNLSQIDVPIVGCVTRLVAQKGIHLIKHAAWRTLERGAQFVLLGSAPDGRVQGEFNALRDQLKAQYHDRAALIFQYDEPLSHQIYAGQCQGTGLGARCDMFLVPSIFEPCGLTQMIAMQYGTVPVVRKTGGLADTVFDVDHEEQRAAAAGMETNGFVFESVDAAGMDYALNRALSMWYSDKAGWRQLVHRVMRQDWSWYSPALDYVSGRQQGVELYYKAMRS